MNGAFWHVAASRKIHRRCLELGRCRFGCECSRRFQQLQIRALRVPTRRLFYRAITVIVPFVLAAANQWALWGIRARICRHALGAPTLAGPGPTGDQASSVHDRQDTAADVGEASRCSQHCDQCQCKIRTWRSRASRQIMSRSPGRADKSAGGALSSAKRPN